MTTFPTPLSGLPPAFDPTFSSLEIAVRSLLIENQGIRPRAPVSRRYGVAGALPLTPVSKWEDYYA